MEDQEPKKKADKKAKLVEVKCTLPEGKLFTSAGIVKAGEVIEIPVDEAKHFCQVGKAEVAFPE